MVLVHSLDSIKKTRHELSLIHKNLANIDRAIIDQLSINRTLDRIIARQPFDF